MAAPPESTKTSLHQRLSTHAREYWPQLTGIDVEFRGALAYVTGHLADGDTIPLMRLRYGGSAARWGFAIYLASKDGYQDSALPTGDFAGTPEDALDTACGLYLDDPTAQPRTTTHEGLTNPTTVSTGAAGGQLVSLLYEVADDRECPR